jgi:4-amino-4-deoxychorismate lyase
MNMWINGRERAKIDIRDRGLQYGDGVFETMRIRRGRVRLLEYHLDRLFAGCGRLGISAPVRPALRRELERAATLRREGVLKLIVTRGVGPRGYRPAGDERCTRILSLHPLPKGVLTHAGPPARVRVCSTTLGLSPQLAGLKTLNRLESVMARAEWRDARIWEGLMQDADENIVCGTMSNLFLRRGRSLLTPVLDRCGVAGVMRRWVLQTAQQLDLRATERPIRWRDFRRAEEVFMTNALVGVRSVGAISLPRGIGLVRLSEFDAADRLRALLGSL